MKKMNGVELVEAVDAPDVETYVKWSAIQRSVNRGYKAFLARRGLTDTTGLREHVTAGATEGKALKQARA